MFLPQQAAPRGGFRTSQFVPMVRKTATLFLIAFVLGCGEVESPDGRTVGTDVPKPMLIAPLLSNTAYCDEALGQPFILSEDEAAIHCATIGKTAGARIDRVLGLVGPRESPNGRFQLGYTLIVPMSRYFRRSPSGWELDVDTLRASLAVIGDSERPVVVHLSGTHFDISGFEMSRELAADPNNVMWTRDGPARSADYFGVEVTGWTLADLDAPVNRLRGQAFVAAVEALCALPELARRRIVAVTILGETHFVFPSLRAGPGDAVAAGDLTDYSPAMRHGFRDWLRARFESIDGLNTQLGSRYTTFDAVEPPSRDVMREGGGTRLDHVDSFAAGRLPIYGWLHDRRGRSLEVQVRLDGSSLGNARLGLSRTDVTEANPAIADPNIGFRLDLDHRTLAPGVHEVEIVVRAGSGEPLLLARREITVIDRNLAPGAHQPGVRSELRALSEDLDLTGWLDAPAGNRPSLLYNPLAELWLEYRNDVVRRYVEHFARLTSSRCIGRDLVYAHQIAPTLYGGWNDDVLAVSGSQTPSIEYQQGATLYGGTAFGTAFFDFRRERGWSAYGVNELHPLVPLTEDSYLRMFEDHRVAGATFVAPYYMDTLPVDSVVGTLDRYLIAPQNPMLASNRFYAAIRVLMQR